MNKKIIGIVFVILIFIGLYVSVPSAKSFTDQLILGRSSQIKETKVAQHSSKEKVSSVDEEEGNQSPDIPPEVITSPSTAAVPSGIKTQPVNHSTKTNSDLNAVSKNDNSTNSSNITDSGSAVHSSNQVSRGESAVDETRYPLLSKVNGSFGQFRYRDVSGGRIEVDPSWVAENIVTITLPGLNRQVQVHKDAADNFITAFNYIKNGTANVNGQEVPLLSLIKTMDGTYVTRHVNWNPARGLSNHSWGTAIDINASGHFGYVDPDCDLDDPNLILWEKAFQPAGFSWGNRYSDSMHYELLK